MCSFSLPLGRSATTWKRRIPGAPAFPLLFFVLVWMAVGMGMVVLVLVGMRGFGLYLYRRLNGVGSPLRRLRQRLARGCGGVRDFVPSQISRQRLILGERTGLLLDAP
jgi:hypothetical protein